MKTHYLFPHRYKPIGWGILIPSALFGLYALLWNYEPDFMFFKVPAFFIDEMFTEHRYFGIIKNNLLNEVLGILVIIGLILVAFSKEKIEDEYIAEIRLESLVWAVYFNYAILLLTFVWVYDFSFLWVMIFNMFTILLFFIVRFNFKIWKLKKSTHYEE